MEKLGLVHQKGVFYIGGADVLTAPLKTEEEQIVLEKMESGDEGAKQLLIERNLRLVAHIAKKYTRTRKQPTNADMYINAEGVVTEAISNLNAKGTVKVRGSVWTARSSNDEVEIPENTTIVVEKIEGVKLIVRPKN